MTTPSKASEGEHPRIAAMRERDTPPPNTCSRHGHYVESCGGCIDAFVDGVAWHLVHPGQSGGAVEQTNHRPALDPTPCGICGAVIGEGLMTLHIGATHPPATEQCDDAGTVAE